MSVSKIVIIDSSGDVSEFHVASKSAKVQEAKVECAACESGIASKQNHHGSPFCENGSFASGGRYAHCQCDVCSTL